MLTVEISDLRSFDEQLYERLTAFPLDVLNVMEGALKNYLKEKNEEYSLKTE